MSDSPRENQFGSSPTRKEYKAPKLRSYGNIRDITNDIGKSSKTNDSFAPTKPAGVKSTAI